HATIAHSVFHACWFALIDHCASLRSRGHVGEATEQELRSQAGGDVYPPMLRVVSASAGAGKTSFAIAFLMAMTRLAEQRDDFLRGAVFLVEQIRKADQLFREVEALMPGKVAIWTSDLKEIVKWLNARGYRTRRGKTFGVGSIHKLLTNTIYIGR